MLVKKKPAPFKNPLKNNDSIVHAIQRTHYDSTQHLKCGVRNHFDSQVSSNKNKS